jgi:hypothetical protein
MDPTRYLSFAGRLLIGLPFAMGGLSKLVAYGPTTAAIAAAACPYRHSPLRSQFLSSLAVDFCCAGTVLLSNRALVPRQLRRPEPDDPLPQERHDGGWPHSDRCLWRWRAQSRQPLWSCCQGGDGPLTGSAHAEATGAAFIQDEGGRCP